MITSVFQILFLQFLNPTEITFISLHWALDPILLTLNAESIEGRQESKNNFLLVYNCLSVIDIMLVAVYSVISLAIVSIIGKAVIEPLK